mmetsp:Transcript_25784/g.58735  ORF Transcript_25784/g.58735 Transcript_25784/m.58735 type:complete len:111 (+) Transcript_25784:68-400(+)
MAMQQQRRSRASLAPVLCLVLAAAFLVAWQPAFLGAGSPAPRTGAAFDHSVGVAVAPAAALLATPLAAQAAEGLPTPILGIGMLSIIVVLVLLISGIVIGRGLVETIDDL